MVQPTYKGLLVAPQASISHSGLNKGGVHPGNSAPLVTGFGLMPMPFGQQPNGLIFGGIPEQLPTQQLGGGYIVGGQG